MLVEDPDLRALLQSASREVAEFCNRLLQLNLIPRHLLIGALRDWDRQGRPLNDRRTFGAWLVQRRLLAPDALARISREAGGQSVSGGANEGREREGEVGAGSGAVRGESNYRLGPFDIIEELGRGGMGVVYSARHRESGNIVALKVIPPGMSPKRLERFKREINTTVGLDHPFIVAVYACGSSGGYAYYAMEVVYGVPLDEWFQTNEVTIEEILRLVRDVARGLQHAHEHGVVHRDVKPANIMVLPDGTPKITDFGLAKASGDRDLTRTGQMLGTPYYMSPEQAAGEAKRAGPAADQYALGVILFELLTGDVPFDARTADELFAKIRDEPPPDPRELAEDLPDDVVSILLRTLEKEPKFRFPSTGALADAIDRYLAGESVGAGGAGWIRKGAHAIRKRPRRVALVLVIAFFAVLGVWFATRRQSGETASSTVALSTLLTEVSEVRHLVEEEELGRAEERGLQLLERLPRAPASSERRELERNVRLLLARIYRFHGRAEEGIEVLEPLRSSPSGAVPEVAIAHADLLRRLGRFGEARERLESIESNEAGLLRIDIFVEEGKLQQAEAECTRLLGDEASAPDLLGERARIRLRLEDAAGAARDVRKLRSIGGKKASREAQLLEAGVLRVRGRRVEAHDRLVEAPADDADVRYEKARLLWELGLERFCEPLLDGLDSFASRRLRCRLLLGKGSIAEAGALAEKLAERGRADALLLRSLCLLAANELAPAEQLARRVAEQTPHLRKRALRLLLFVQAARDAHDRVRETIRLLDGEKGFDPRSRVLAIRLLIEADEGTRVQAWLNDAEDTSDPALRLQRVGLLTSDGGGIEPRERDRMRESLRLEAGPAQALLRQEWRLRRRTPQDSAEVRGRLLRAACRLAPWWSEPRVRLATFLQEQGGEKERREAERLAKAALRNDPTDVRAYLLRAELSDDGLEPGMKKKDWKPILKLVPDHPRALTWSARHHLTDNRREEAREALEAVLDENPYNREALNIWLTVLLQSGKREQADEIRERLAMLDSPAARRREVNRLARLAGGVQDRSPSRAQELIEKALLLAPRAPQLWTEYAQVCLDAGDVVSGIRANLEASFYGPRFIGRLVRTFASIIQMPLRSSRIELRKLLDGPGDGPKAFQGYALRALLELLTMAEGKQASLTRLLLYASRADDRAPSDLTTLSVLLTTALEGCRMRGRASAIRDTRVNAKMARVHMHALDAILRIGTGELSQARRSWRQAVRLAGREAAKDMGEYEAFKPLARVMK